MIGGQVFRVSGVITIGGNPMKCKKIKKIISQYMDAEFDAAAAKRVAAHLERCDECAAHLRALDKTWNLLDILLEEKARPFFAEQVVHRIESRTKFSHIRHNVGDFFNRALVPAAVAAGILVGIVLGNQLHRKMVFEEAISNVDPTIQPVTNASEDFTAFPPGSLADTYLVMVSLDR